MRSAVFQWRDQKIVRRNCPKNHRRQCGTSAALSSREEIATTGRLEAVKNRRAGESACPTQRSCRFFHSFLRSRFGKMPHVERVLPNRDREGVGPEEAWGVLESKRRPQDWGRHRNCIASSYSFTVTVFTSVYCCNPYSPSSRPIPDCLNPPNGARVSRTL